jgi:pyrimidine-specific ribonucleoside hydrolase
MQCGRSLAAAATLLIAVALVMPRVAGYPADIGRHEPACVSIAAGDSVGRHRQEIAIIIDTDMGLDDVRAIFALLASERAAIRAVVTVEGSASIGKGTDNLVGLLESLGRGLIPVMTGRHDARAAPPEWRKTANGLAGAAFPPPRSVSASPYDPVHMHKILKQHGDRIHYLALGPLSNLARLGSERPGALDLIDTVFIPVRRTTVRRTGAQTVTGWNLAYDQRSAETVLRDAKKIVLIDLSAAAGLDHRGALTSIHGSSGAARWIRRTTSELAGQNVHLFMHDELAAAAIIDSGLLELEEGSFEFETAQGGEMIITPSGSGNIRIAALTDPDEAVELLHILWESETGGATSHEHAHAEKHHGEQGQLDPAAMLKAFHGHLGPYVVLGYRMGRIALEAAHSDGHFGIAAEVHSALEPPRSCLIDGIQLGSGCTLGKRNITIHEFGGPAYAVFTTDRRDTVTVSLRSGIPGLVGRLIDTKGVEAAGANLMELDAKTLFDVRISRSDAGD